MTNEQYEKLVELVDSIEFIDKELIDTNKFIAKFHKIFSKDYEAPTIYYPWTNKPGVRDIGKSSAPYYPFYEPIQISYDSSLEHNPNFGKCTIDIPEEYKFINFDKTNGVDGMKFTVSDDNTHSNTYRDTKFTNEMQCVECVDQETTLQSKYTDPKNLDTV